MTDGVTRRDAAAAFAAIWASIPAAIRAGLTDAQRVALLEGYDREGRGPKTPAAAVGRGETETGLSNQPRAAVEPPRAPFFPALKDLVTVGYFTSRLGATKAVRYDPVPGAYHGCVPLKTIGRAWAI